MITNLSNLQLWVIKTWHGITYVRNGADTAISASLNSTVEEDVFRESYLLCHPTSSLDFSSHRWALYTVYRSQLWVYMRLCSHYWSRSQTSNMALERVAERAWWTKSQSSLLFRLALDHIGLNPLDASWSLHTLVFLIAFVSSTNYSE